MRFTPTSRHDSARVLQPESDRMLHLDAMRLLAAAGVVICHLLPSADFGPYQEIVVARSQLLAQLVDLFFVISGFVIFDVYAGRVGSWRGYGQFMLRRVARLAPLHWLMLAIFIVMPLGAAAFGQTARHPQLFTWQCILPNIFFLQSTGVFCPFLSFNFPSWSISAEMGLYLAFPLVAYIARRARIAPLIAAATAFSLLVLFTSDSWTQWAIPGGAWRAAPSFLLGCGLASIRQSLPRFRLGGLAAALCFALFLAGVAMGAAPLVLLAFLYLSAICAILADADHIGGPVTRVAAMGAQLTYSSYMIHLLIINVMVSLIADRVLHLTGTGKNAAVLATFAAIWPLSYLSLRFFELPMRRKIAAWGNSGRHQSPRQVAA